VTPDLARWPTAPTLRRITWTAFFATGLIAVIFAVHDRPMGANGIVAFELAYRPAQAALLFAVWGPAGIQAARESLWIDFLFMPAYAFWLGGMALGQWRHVRLSWMAGLGIYAAALPFAAWALDFIENAALLGVLADTSNPSAGLLMVAGWAAEVKFALLGASVVYVVAAWGAQRIGRRTAE
jgi:hypothetical protein